LCDEGDTACVESANDGAIWAIYSSIDILRRVVRRPRELMTRYEIVFEGDAGTRETVPKPGETVEISGELWDVASVDDVEGGFPRVHLAQHPLPEPAPEQHVQQLPPQQIPPVKLAAPDSFESELVYTLNDLSTRLSGLAGVLNAYWGKGAA
jgi:hypothetical protein